MAKGLKALEAACKRNDRAEAYTACCAWLNLSYGAGSLKSSQLEKISPPLAQELAAMERALYAEGIQAPWTGASLWRALAGVKSGGPGNDARRARPDILPPLYPAQSNR